jgi:hypothetical protein
MKRWTSADRRKSKRRRKEVTIYGSSSNPMGLFKNLPEEIIQVIVEFL